MSELASDHAGRVVGLYGDPTVSWSILLEARLSSTLTPEKARMRLAVAVEERPWLGAAPDVEAVRSEELPAVRDRFAEAAYERGAPLLRVAVGADEPVVLIAAHHGALDGLGLLAVLGLVLDVPISSAAKGIGTRTADRSFLVSAFHRLAEALFAPPARITPERAESGPGDVFSARILPRSRFGSAAFAAAAADLTETWNARHGEETARVVAAVGASWRGGAAPEPLHDSAFFRLRLGRKPAVAEVGALLATQPPEPDFPARSSRIARLGTRLLAGRLGSTYLVSNLGVVSAADAVTSIAFYPAASGRSGVAFGAVTVGETSTLTVRARRKDFDDAATADLADGIVEALRRQDPGAGDGHPGHVAHE
ncbi:hypothetical protein [Amycolatopsis sp. EV170708-02-1]|uniref:hypothetical protein n=1 Tax=Amycolatopsis sp. EV170708-02-1 TaxID=2919322 RepID=UPI001F0BBD8D|nr:hypothetical protein [Amycolatopsis sp. EV170708-02-1]UMO99476.1 hypothetical protein MJQ72_23280 [Amycolatopsis sp. EV170708-02-1]